MRLSAFQIVFLYSLLNLLLYFSALNNAFLSDDYDSLYRIEIERIIIVKEFFRPLIDVSFYLNLLVSGFNPWSYYLLNIIVHIINSILIYHVVVRYGVYSKRDFRDVAFVSGLLFIAYPFHNEGVVWLTGRLSSIACCFALMSISVMLSSKSPLTKFTISFVLYILGLLAYESILLLPFIMIILLWDQSKNVRTVLKEVVFASTAMLSYLVTRYYLSGAIYGAYGERMVNDWGLVQLVTKFLKVLGRTVLPPVENSFLLSGLFVLVAVLVAYWLIRKSGKEVIGKKIVSKKLALSFLFALAIPAFFGLSTRTSEGDRLLYFPSVFIAVLLSYHLLAIKRRLFRNLALAATLAYFLPFLIINNMQWEKASQASQHIIEEVIKNKEKEIVLVNVPDELEGAYVFRNGFYKALILNNVDTSRVKINNYLTRLEYLDIAGRIKIEPGLHIDSIAPATLIKTLPDLDSLHIFNNRIGTYINVSRPASILYFWDKYKWNKVF